MKTIILFFLINFLFITNISLALDPKINLGIDVLQNNNFQQLKGKKVGLLTNHSGRNKFGKLTAKIFQENENINLISLFVPEHGFYTTIPAGEKVDDDLFEGTKVLSLYGKNRRPTKDYLKDCDIIVIDIQDIGLRSYTFLSTVFYMLDACSEYGKEVLVLDRPNPLGGINIDGNIVKKGHENFISLVPITYMHGLTFGELCNMMNDEAWLKKKCNLKIVKMENWKREMQWEETGLNWFPTSPHIPTVNAIRGAAVLGIWGELGFISIGIGTTSPFQYLGHTDLNINQESINYDGFYLEKAYYRPFYGLFKGKNVPGYLLRFKKNNHFKPYTNSLKLMFDLRLLNPNIFNPKKLKKRSKKMFQMATGTDQLFQSFFTSQSIDIILSEANKGVPEFIKLREKYLLY